MEGDDYTAQEARAREAGGGTQRYGKVRPRTSSGVDRDIARREGEEGREQGGARRGEEEADERGCRCGS